MVDHLRVASQRDLHDRLLGEDLPVSAMLNYAAGAIVFMVVSIAVPYTAAGIAGGTIGLALSHTFEAAYIAQTVIRPIASALQTGFNKVAQLGNASPSAAAKELAGSTQWISVDRPNGSAISAPTADSVCPPRKTFAAHR